MDMKNTNDAMNDGPLDLPDFVEPQDPPIAVTGSTLPPMAATLVRYALVTLCTMLVSRGILPEGSVEGVSASLLGVAVVGYGLWKTRSKQSQLIALERHVPNSIARLRG